MNLLTRGIVAGLLLVSAVFARAQEGDGEGPVENPVVSNRLSEIATQLKGGKMDNAALLNEAVRLCGFSVWSEDRARLAEPLTSPGLGLAITDKEIEGYAKLFKRGDRVELADLVNAFDPIYREAGGEKGLPFFVDRLVRGNLFKAKVAPRMLASFLQDLARTHGEANDVPITMASQLDPVQALLIMRVVSEEIRVPLSKAGKQPVLYASIHPEFDQEEPPGWAEDAFAGGITGLFEEVVGGIEKVGGKVTNAVGKANALAAISKFILTYQFLRGEMTLEGKGQPLIRTKDEVAGDERTTVARFFIDGTGVTDWLKDNRKWFHALGLDLDTPKSGPLKKVETYWRLSQSYKYATKQLVQAVWGTTDLSRLKTNDAGEARVTWEGKPQPKRIDPKKAMPVMKSVWISVSPQVKSVEVQQDLVDAVTGAIGIKEGPAGLLSPIMEILYRMKWNCPLHFELEVRDWIEGETIGQFTVEASGSGFQYQKGNTVKMTIDHAMTINDLEMQVIGGEAPPALDPIALKNMSPDVRKQFEAGFKQMAEMAKRRSFNGIGPGRGTMRVNDTSLRQYDEISCSVSTVTIDESWKGSAAKDIVEFMGPYNFIVQANLVEKTATVAFTGAVDGKHTYTVDGKTKTDPGQFSVMDRITIDPKALGPDGNILLPLKETPLPSQNASNYYGAATITFTFGPNNKFKGSMIISYSVTRKHPPKDEE